MLSTRNPDEHARHVGRRADTPLKVLTVLGTRPEAIKLAPVLRELDRRGDCESRVCVTGQHREMLGQVLDMFRIVPHHDLAVMRDAQTPTQTAAAILTKLEPVLLAEKPDWLIVQGDTTTVAAASLAGFYGKVKVAHVEAGLRTYDRQQPFPEEINRRVASAVVDLHLAPTATARQNLLREGIPESTILVTGNPVIDALKLIAAEPYDPRTGPLAGVDWSKRVILVTAHRRENFGAPLRRICDALRAISEEHEDVQIVFPVHLNPAVKTVVEATLGGVPRITLTAPLEYRPLVYLMTRCCLVLTDSGGIQEEAPGLGKPVLVLRETTERPEGVASGNVALVGTDTTAIRSAVRRLLTDVREYQRMARAANPYGDGNAAPRIVSALVDHGHGERSVQVLPRCG